MDDVDKELDGFGMLHRWTKAVTVLSAVGGVAALIAGLLYLNDNYTNRGWGLIGLALAALVFAGVSYWAMKAAEQAQDPKPELPPKEPTPAKEPKPTLEPKKPLPPKKPLTPKEQAAVDKADAAKDKASADKASAAKPAADAETKGDTPR